MNKKNNVEEPKMDLSVVSDEEKRTNQKTKINYETTRTPKQTTVNFNRVFSSSVSTSKTSGKTKASLSEEQKTLIAKAYTTRQSQDNIMVGDIKAKITNNVVLEVKASYYESLAKYKNKRVTLTPTMKDTLKSAGKEGVNAVRNAFDSQDDVGSQTVGGIITATVTTTKALGATRKATSAVESFVKNSPQTIKKAKEKIVKVGNKAYQICGTADKMYLTIKQSLPLLKGGFVPMKNALVANALKNGLHKTANIQRIIKLTKKIKQKYQSVKKVAKNVKNVCKHTIKVVKIVAIDIKLNGKISRNILKRAKDKAKTLIFKAKIQGLKAVNVAGKSVAKNAVKGGAFAVKRVIPKGIKGVGSAIGNVGGIMASSENEMIRGVGYSMTVGKYTVKTTATTTKYTAKFVKTAPKKIHNGVNKVKTATKKTVSTAKKTVKHANKNGLKQTSKKIAGKAKDKVAKASYEAGKSVVNIVINIAKKAMGKMVIPLIIAGVMMGVLGGVAGAGGAVAGYYLSGEFVVEGVKKVGEAVGDFLESVGDVLESAWESIVGFFSGDDNEGTSGAEEIELIVTDIEEYLMNNVKGIRYQRAEYIKNITENLSSYFRENGGEYDRIMLKLSGSTIEITKASEIKNVLSENFWTAEVIYEKVQPLFYVRILVEYNLQPTVSEADLILDQVIRSVIGYGGFESNLESCSIPCKCGIIHASDNCLHSSQVIHTEYTCDKCCVRECVGHEITTLVCPLSLIPMIRLHTCDSECQLVERTTITYCEDLKCGFSCSGTEKCENHSTWYATLDMERNMENFVKEYIDKPIAELESKGSNRTPEENESLSKLKDYAGIAKEFIKKSSR